MTPLSIAISGFAGLTWPLWKRLVGEIEPLGFHGLYFAEPVSFTGRFYRLQEAQLLPLPQRPGGIPILVGGIGPKRILPLLARYADIWNPQLLTPDDLRERSARLDELLRAEGRSPSAVKRTVNLRVACGRSPEELEQRVNWLRHLIPAFAGTPLDALLEMLRAYFGVFVGPPEALIAHIQTLSAAGAEEIILEWAALDDLASIHLIAEEVLPHVQA